MLTSEDKKSFINQYRRTLDRYMKFGLASVSKKRMPSLELALDEGCYTDSHRGIIHMGIGMFQAETEEDLMRWTLYVLGHEMQHVLSTTEKGWSFGLNGGFRAVCEALSKKIEPHPRKFPSERSYDVFLSDMEKQGYYLSKESVMNLVHFIINSLEDGRIERLRANKRPGFKENMIACRGEEWMRSPVSKEMEDDLINPSTHLLVVLNQVLYLSTMSLYQKGFTGTCSKDPDIHSLIQKLIPHIRKGVSSPNCRGCMEEAVKICSILGEEIAEVSKMSEFEKLLSQLISEMMKDQSFSAMSQDEETGEEGSMQIALFGDSDLETDEEKKEKGGGIGMSGGQKKKDPSEDSGDGTGKKADSKEEDGKGTGSGNSDGKKEDSGSKENGTENASSGGNSESGNMNDKMAGLINEMKGACQEDVDMAIRDGYIDKRSQPKSAVEKNGDDTLPDLSDLKQEYDYDVTMEEIERSYTPDTPIPADILGEANTLKRKVRKLFENMQQPALRCQKTGRIDAGNIYKVAMNQMDFFAKKQKVSQFDGCCYILQDNSGSMGDGPRSKRYYCCRAVSIIEHAFTDIMPVKIAAFDANGSSSVRHRIIKNWSEKIHNSGAWNFYTNDNVGWGNKDGYSIRVATKELLTRPGQKKILFVLSDGLPSDYPSTEQAYSDVASAVKEARKAGIVVVAVYFGDYVADDAPDVVKFREMYEKNYIAVLPEEITGELIRNMKRFCFR